MKLTKIVFSTERLFYLIYTILMIASVLLGILKLGLFAKILVPKEFGEYSFVLSIYIFVMYLGSAGLNEALINIGGLAQGSGNFKKIERLRDIAICYGGLGIMFVGSLFAISVHIFIHDQSTIDVLSETSILALAAFEYNIINSYLRVKQRFVLFSLMLFLKASITLAVGYWLASIYGAKALVLVESFAFFILFLIFGMLVKPNFKFLVRSFANVNLLKKCIRNGLPVLSSMFIRNISMLGDRLLIAATVGWVALAKYNFAMTLYLIGFTLLGFLSNIWGPRWLSEFGKHKNPALLFNNIKKLAQMITILMVMSAVPLFLILPAVIERFYPAYAGSDFLWTVLFIYMGITILMPTVLFDWVFIALSQEKNLLNMSIVTTLFSIVLMFFVWFFYSNIIAYSLAFLLVRLFNAVLYVKYLRTGQKIETVLELAH